MTALLGGFVERHLSVGDIRIHVRTAGSGPPLLLLHGYPQSLWMWHRVAPMLAATHSVVLADLRGYGRSSAPAPEPDHSTYSKRAMAADQVEVMAQLGHDRFAVVGHDRGGRVAHRMALDVPDRVVALAVLDIVPTLHMFEHVDRAMATSYFHWFFLTQPDGLPERLIGSDPAAWIGARFARRHIGANPIDPRAMTRYVEDFGDPAVIAATCADYRAAATIDLADDRLSRERGHEVTAPLLAVWGSRSYVGRNFDVVSVWKQSAADVRGMAVEADHYVAEEAPAETVECLSRFLEEQSW